MNRGAQVAKPGMAAVLKTASRKGAQVRILPWAFDPRCNAYPSPARRRLRPGRGVHDYEGKLRRALERIESSDLPDDAKRAILDFVRASRANGRGPARTLRYVTDLRKIAVELEPAFLEPTRGAVERLLADVEDSDAAPDTKLEVRKTLKAFYKWFRDGTYKETVAWVKTTRSRNNDKLPESLITEAEVRRMIEAASHPRDRTVVSVMWETGARVGEFLTLHVKHVQFDDLGMRLTLKGKTGMRRILLVDSTPYLAEWLASHPKRSRPEAPLWVGIGTVGRDEPLQYAALRKLLAQLAGKAGVKKGSNPHNFRHSRATALAKHLTEAQMDQYFGWVRGSDMPATYVHLSGRDVDEAILKLRGLKPAEPPPESDLAPKACPRCDLANKATGKFCSRCGAALDRQAAMEAESEATSLDEKLAHLLSDRKVQDFLVRRMRDLKIR